MTEHAVEHAQQDESVVENAIGGDAPVAGGKNRDDGRVKQLWRNYKEAPTSHLRNQLIENYLPLVRQCAQRIHAKLPATVQLDDLISAGALGLMDAIEAFQLDRAVQFSTFSAMRIRGAILDELRSMDWVPRLVRTNAKRLEGAARELEAELGRSATDEEIADRLNVSHDRYQNWADDTRAITVTSLSGLTRSKRGGEEEAGEAGPLPDPRAADPLQESQRRALKDAVTRGLSRAERLVVTLYYYEDLTMREVGQVLDLSESRVSQMHTQILRRLRAAAGERDRADAFSELAA